MMSELVTALHGDCVQLMAELPVESIDAIVTDPPYGLGFMGKGWDALPPGVDWAKECLRVLKPGGHLLAFGGTRTWHRLACAIEDGGFELRDSIAWLYGSGFPKSLNVGDGWGTALKPAFEPIVMARKPFKGTVTANVLKHGTGAMNIDATRIPMGDEYDPTKMQRQSSPTAGMNGLGESGFSATHEQPTYNEAGRWPANIVLDESQAIELGEQARYFYCPKAPKSERPTVNGVTHPTVKPLALMRWLVRLVTPPGGVVLDPFAGSGTTGEACALEGFECLLIESEADYLLLIKHRLEKEPS